VFGLRQASSLKKIPDMLSSKCCPVCTRISVWPRRIAVVTGVSWMNSGLAPTTVKIFIVANPEILSPGRRGRADEAQGDAQRFEAVHSRHHRGALLADSIAEVAQFDDQRLRAWRS